MHPELLALAIAGGFAMLGLQARFRRRSRRALARRSGFQTRRSGIDHVAAGLANTVLHAVSDGGHESSVIIGPLMIGDHKIRQTIFDYAFQRDVRGEWAYVETSPAFRLTSPTTVICFELPRPAPHIVIKRRGHSEVIGDRELESVKSVATLGREVLGMERAIAVEPPASLPHLALSVAPLSKRYHVWAPDDASLREAVGSDALALLASDRVPDLELVFELTGDLLVVYPAGDGVLTAGDSMLVAAFGESLCRRLLSNSGNHPR